ncbi:MAG TPA: c-type cytochrome, partial [Parvularculaceae bacterium]|nr:c-type cytochrome [Parvularculaceae bacterium]
AWGGLALWVNTDHGGARGDGGDSARLLAGAQAIALRAEYGAKCASCHGERGEGGQARVDFTSAEAVASLSREDMIAALSDAHGGRLSAPLGADEKQLIVDFIREYLMLPAPFEDASVGRRIYSESCSVCHGERGDGASWARNSLFPPPRDFTSSDPALLTRADMIAAVTFGRAGTAMMPFATQLKPDEVAQTVDYIRNAFMAHESSSPAPTPMAPVAATDGGYLKGDYAVGRALYHANCEQCHGRDGNGEGRRAYFMVVKPANFTSPGFRMRMDRARLPNAIAKGVVGSTMPAWEKVLPPDKIADLAEYVYDAFVAPDEAALASDGNSPRAAEDEKKN